MWKKSFRNIPVNILKRVDGFSTNNVIVAAVKKIPIQDIKNGKYKHLSIEFSDGKVLYPESIMPKEKWGRFSSININGQEIKRTDLPKVSKTYSWDVPNWGDSYNGTHEVSRSRMVYQVEFFAPKNLQLNIEEIGRETKDGIEVCIFKFSTSAILDRTEKLFNEELLFNINLLQENTGVSNVFQSDATRSDYLKNIYLNWEILPPGDRDETVDRILSGMKTSDQEIRKKLTERYDFLAKLSPVAYIQGTSGFQRYFGAKFSEKLVVFENIEYGNAIYAMFENWEELAKLSRLELLRNKTNSFIRVIHNTGWEKLLKEIVKTYK